MIWRCVQGLLFACAAVIRAAVNARPMKRSMRVIRSVLHYQIVLAVLFCCVLLYANYDWDNPLTVAPDRFMLGSSSLVNGFAPATGPVFNAHNGVDNDLSDSQNTAGLLSDDQEIVPLFDTGQDNPTAPGCVCIHRLPNCQGPVSGRVVDECYPKDGVTLQESVAQDACTTMVRKRYNCEEVLGSGASCEVRKVTCCGVPTQSAFCVNHQTLKAL